MVSINLNTDRCKASPALATEEANDWLVDHPQVRVGVPNGLAPLISINDQARGFDVVW